MATTNLDSANLKGVATGGLINEDVMQEIWDISAVPLPFSDAVGSGTVKNSYAEWTQDSLATPDLTNAKIDGADTTGDNDTATGARVGNHCQISTKTVQVSTRARESDTIGRADELAYQVMMRQRELRRDVEAICLSNQASVADDGSATAGKAGTLRAWLTTNTDLGATGADGGFSAGTVTAATPGTKRALSETAIRDVAQSVYTEGGNPTLLMSTPGAIRQLSEYMFSSSARIATLTSDVREKTAAATATGAVNVFVTDFGVTLEMVANRVMQPRVAGETEVYMIDPQYIRLGYLHGYRVEPLAKTGLAEKRQMAVDWTLCVLTEKAHGVVADIDFAINAVA